METEGYIFNLIDDLSKLSRLLSKVKVPEVWHGELLVLEYLHYHQGETVLPVDLKNELKLTSSRISIILSVLQNKNHIDRVMAQNDRRKVWVTITPEGEAYYNEQIKELLRLLDPIFAAVGTEDMQALGRIVAKLVQMFEAAAQAETITE